MSACSSLCEKHFTVTSSFPPPCFLSSLLIFIFSFLLTNTPLPHFQDPLVHTQMHKCGIDPCLVFLSLSLHVCSHFFPLCILLTFFIHNLFLSNSHLSFCLSCIFYHPSPSLLPPSLSAPFLSPSPWLAVLQAARALQLQRASSCDALLATATAAAAAVGGGGEEEDGTGMELTQLLDRIRAQCEQSRIPSSGERHLGLGAISNPAPGLVGPPRAGAGAAAASRTHRGALSEVRIHFCTIFTCLFVF